MDCLGGFKGVPSKCPFGRLKMQCSIPRTTYNPKVFAVKHLHPVGPVEDSIWKTGTLNKELVLQQYGPGLRIEPLAVTGFWCPQSSRIFTVPQGPPLANWNVSHLRHPIELQVCCERGTASWQTGRALSGLCMQLA